MKLKKRILEPTEEIDGKAAWNYVTFSKWRRGTYSVVAYDIFEKIGKNFEGKILEVGCGGGLLIKELRKLLPKSEIIGIDASEEIIKIARDSFPSFEKVKLMKATVYALPFESDYFDLVVCQGTLHHFYHPEKALKEILRVARKQGLVYIQDLRRDVSKQRIKEKLETMKDEYQKERELTSIKASFTRSEIRRLMNGLEIESYKFKPAAFSSENIMKNQKILLQSRFNEIKYMKVLEYILWIKK